MQQSTLFSCQRKIGRPLLGSWREELENDWCRDNDQRNPDYYGIPVRLEKNREKTFKEDLALAGSNLLNAVFEKKYLYRNSFLSEWLVWVWNSWIL